MSELDEKVDKKLEEIHEDVKGGFQAVHTRMDREIQERQWSLVGILQAVRELEERVVGWFRK